MYKYLVKNALVGLVLVAAYIVAMLTVILTVYESEGFWIAALVFLGIAVLGKNASKHFLANLENAKAQLEQ